jgi:hypothetical protein
LTLFVATRNAEEEFGVLLGSLAEVLVDAEYAMDFSLA